MFLAGSSIIQAAAAAAVMLPGADTDNRGSTGTIYAGLRFDSNGYVYERSTFGTWQNTGAWLLEGAAADYWLWRTINTGILTTDDGDGNQLNTDDLDYDIQNSVEWFMRTASVTFKISDDSAGSNIIVSKTYAFSAYKLGTGTPP